MSTVKELPGVRAVLKTLLIVSFIGFAFVFGLVAPDVDQRLPFLTHRSLLTHGPWFALLATWLAQKSRSPSAVPLIACSFVIGLVFHFAADLFPKAWMGVCLGTHPVLGPSSSSGECLLADWLIGGFSGLRRVSWVAGRPQARMNLPNHCRAHGPAPTSPASW